MKNGRITNLILLSCLIMGLTACASDVDAQNTQALEAEQTSLADNPAAEEGVIVGHIPYDGEEEIIGAVAVATSPENHSDEAVAEGVDISHKYQYKVRGKRYKVFKNAGSFQEIGMASWYGPGFHGKKTANGERYNMHAMTAAHKTLPLGSRVQVTHLATGKKIIVRINDRGPFHKGRIIDLSKKAAKKLGILKKGYGKVHVKALK